MVSASRLSKFAIALVLAHGTYALAQSDFPAPTGDPGIIPAGAKMEKLFDGDCFAEGPAVGPDNMVYWSDITFTKFCKDPSGKSPMAGHIWRYDPNSGKEMPTNVAFGRGALANVLYVTSGKSLYRIKVGKKGYQLP